MEGLAQKFKLKMLSRYQQLNKLGIVHFTAATYRLFFLFHFLPVK